MCTLHQHHTPLLPSYVDDAVGLVLLWFYAPPQPLYASHVSRYECLIRLLSYFVVLNHFMDCRNRCRATKTYLSHVVITDQLHGTRFHLHSLFDSCWEERYFPLAQSLPSYRHQSHSTLADSEDGDDVANY